MPTPLSNLRIIIIIIIVIIVIIIIIIIIIIIKVFSRRRVVLCERMDGRTEGQTDMTKFIVAFRNFANTLKNVLFEQKKIKLLDY